MPLCYAISQVSAVKRPRLGPLPSCDNNRASLGSSIAQPSLALSSQNTCQILPAVASDQLLSRWAHWGADYQHGCPTSGGQQTFQPPTASLPRIALPIPQCLCLRKNIKNPPNSSSIRRIGIFTHYTSIKVKALSWLYIKLGPHTEILFAI